MLMFSFLSVLLLQYMTQKGQKQHNLTRKTYLSHMDLRYSKVKKYKSIFLAG